MSRIERGSAEITLIIYFYSPVRDRHIATMCSVTRNVRMERNMVRVASLYVCVYVCVYAGVCARTCWHRVKFDYKFGNLSLSRGTGR